jgi:hypothetical protein
VRTRTIELLELDDETLRGPRGDAIAAAPDE